MQNSKVFPNMEVFLIDSWHQKKQGKEIIFFRQPVALSGEIVPLVLFSETLCHIIRGVCCLNRLTVIWMTYSPFSRWKKVIDSLCGISF